MAQMQLITDIERRCRWSDEQKRAIVAAAFAPGAVVGQVTRQADVVANSANTVALLFMSLPVPG